MAPTKPWTTGVDWGILEAGETIIPGNFGSMRMQEEERAHQIVAAAQEVKAEAILLYDLQNRSTLTDYIVICSGRSQGHVRGICDKIAERLKQAGIKPHTVEGYTEGSWVLLDFGVVIVHIFHPETRAYYDLEGLLKTYPCERFAPPADVPRLSSDEGAAPA